MDWNHCWRDVSNMFAFYGAIRGLRFLQCMTLQTLLSRGYQEARIIQQTNLLYSKLQDILALDSAPMMTG